MRTYRRVLKKGKEIKEIFCDWCGKGNLKDGFFEGGLGRISFGYGSKHEDGKTYEIDICDSCFRKRIKPHAELVSDWICPAKVAEFKKAKRKREILKDTKKSY